MVYSDYELKDIEKYPFFRKVGNMFFELVENDEQKEKLEGVLYEGGYNGYKLCSEVCSKNNSYLEMERRLAMGYLLVRNEDTFDELVSSNINLFHGTNSWALFGIIQNGLQSTEHLEASGIELKTGEESTRTKYARDLDFVSLTDILDIAEEYSQVKEEDRNKGIFNVLIGTSSDELSSLKKITVSSDISEVGVSSLPLKSIRMIGVPSDKVDYVKKIVNNEKIKVLGVDGIEEKFYYMDNLETNIFMDDFNKLKENKSNSKELNKMLGELSSTKEQNLNMQKK